jgi:hypothetical protein
MVRFEKMEQKKESVDVEAQRIERYEKSAS